MPTPEEISAEVAAMLAEREANAARARERAEKTQFVAAPDYLGAMRAEWVAAGVMPAIDSCSNPALSRPREVDPAALAQKSRLAQFLGMCPEEFRAKIDRTRIPNLAAWDRADEWQGQHPGLWLWSAATGRAKSRMLWRKFGQLFVERNRRCLRIRGTRLAEAYYEYHMDKNPAGFYRMFERADVIMLDDLDKVNLRADSTINMPRVIHQLFDEFYEQHKPVLVTANEPIQYFEQRIGKSADRRITAVCAQEIEF